MSTTESTGYTTLGHSSSTTSARDFLSRAKEHGLSVIARLRPWREFLDVSALSLPYSFGESTFRIKKNVSHFSINYTLILLLILFFSLLWHPISMIVFLIVFVAWLFLYFFRDEPLVVFDRAVGDRVVLVVLSLITIVALILSGVWLNVLVSIGIAVALVVLHAAFRFTEDGFDDMESPYGGLLSVVDSPRGNYSHV